MNNVHFHALNKCVNGGVQNFGSSPSFDQEKLSTETEAKENREMQITELEQTLEKEMVAPQEMPRKCWQKLKKKQKP